MLLRQGALGQISWVAWSPARRAKRYFNVEADNAQAVAQCAMIEYRPVAPIPAPAFSSGVFDPIEKACAKLPVLDQIIRLEEHGYTT